MGLVVLTALPIASNDSSKAVVPSLVQGQDKGPVFWDSNSLSERKLIYSVPGDGSWSIDCAGISGTVEWYSHEYSIYCGPQVSRPIRMDTVECAGEFVRMRIPAGADMFHIVGNLDARKFEIRFIKSKPGDP
jgi:hypothetical protein